VAALRDQLKAILSEALRNPYLRAGIDRHREVVYAA
jgi:hypothetical protein